MNLNIKKILIVILNFEVIYMQKQENKKANIICKKKKFKLILYNYEDYDPETNLENSIDEILELICFNCKNENRVSCLEITFLEKKNN